MPTILCYNADALGTPQIDFPTIGLKTAFNAASGDPRAQNRIQQLNTDLEEQRQLRDNGAPPMLAGMQMQGGPLPPII